MMLNFRTTTCLLALIFGVSSVAAPSSSKNLRVEMGRGGTVTNFPPDLQKQQELLAKIQSPNTPKGEKAVACKLLTIHGTDEAVPVLTPLLSDPQLASWARIALEAIPGSTADAALRDAMARLKGLALVGVINSIGERGDAKAVKALSSKLKDPDPEIASAAAVALGKIGGTSAAKPLLAALSKATPGTGAALAEGCIRCAEQFLEESNPSTARKIYDAVRVAHVPRNKAMEATRGAILARGDDGIQLLIEQLRSAEEDRVLIGLSTARELPGKKASEALAAEVRRSPEQLQPLLLLALADRRDAASLPAVVEAARSSSKPMQRVAITVLERIGTLSSAPVLVEVAANPDPALSQAAIDALTRLTVEGLDEDLLSRLTKASGREREALIRVAGQRHMQAALKPILSSAESQEPGVRSAAMHALGSIGTVEQMPGLLTLLDRTTDPKVREQLETALLAISSRNPGAVKPMAPLARSADPAMRGLALRCLSASGGPEALAVVTEAVNDKDPDLQDEAVRVLSTWPNTWPEDGAAAAPLLAVARSGEKKSHQVLALRGYLQYVESDPRLKPEEKVSRIKEAIPLMQRAEEKGMAISVLSETFAPSAIDVLLTFSEDEAVRQDACAALLKLGSRDVSGLPKAERRRALQAVLDKSSAEKVRSRAEEKLKGLD